MTQDSAQDMHIKEGICSPDDYLLYFEQITLGLQILRHQHIHLFFTQGTLMALVHLTEGHLGIVELAVSCIDMSMNSKWCERLYLVHMQITDGYLLPIARYLLNIIT